MTATAGPGTTVNTAQVWLNGRTEADGAADVDVRPREETYVYTATGTSWISEVRAHATASGAPVTGSQLCDDKDDDGMIDPNDNCPNVANPGQDDRDDDGDR